jgi:RimJ/RimL family protein N-acetyltransferase/ActR/RegA family two-component response regulator
MTPQLLVVLRCITTGGSATDMTPSTVVYIIDNDGELGAALHSLLDNYEIQVEDYRTSESFFSSTSAEKDSQSCLLLALNTDCEGGLNRVRELRDSRPELPIIVLCDAHDENLRSQYIDLGATDIVSKSMVDAYVFTRLTTICPDVPNLPVVPPSTMSAPDGTLVTFRMIGPEDAEIEQRFVIALSDRSRYLRFFSGLRELPKHMLRQLIEPAFPISYALIATIATPEGERQIGVARYAPTENKHVAEFAVVVADEWQRAGIASQLLRYIITAATVAGLHRLEGLILRENKPMIKLATKLGFTLSRENEFDPTIIKVIKHLR